MIDCHCSMLLRDSECCTCAAVLRRGALIRARKIEGGAGRHIQCGPCAAEELLPLYDAEDMAMRARVDAEDQAHA